MGEKRSSAAGSAAWGLGKRAYFSIFIWILMTLFQLNLKARNPISTSKLRQDENLFRLAVEGVVLIFLSYQQLDSLLFAQLWFRHFAELETVEICCNWRGNNHMWFLSKSFSSSFFSLSEFHGKITQPARFSKMHRHSFGFNCLCFLAVT